MPAVVAVNVMVRNCDYHTKNFSFILKQGGSWELAPAYEVTYAYNPKRMDVSARDEREWEVQGHYASRFTRERRTASVSGERMTYSQTCVRRCRIGGGTLKEAGLSQTTSERVAADSRLQ